MRGPSNLMLPGGVPDLSGQQQMQLTPVHDPLTADRMQGGFGSLHDMLVLHASAMLYAQGETPTIEEAVALVMEWRQELPAMVAKARAEWEAANAPEDDPGAGDETEAA